MVVKSSYESQDDIPETVDFRELFTEKNGKWELTGIPGLRTQGDVDRLTNSVENERKVSSGYREKLKLFGDGSDVGVDSDLDAWRGRRDKLFSELDRVGELEAAAGDKLDDAKIEEMVERRLQGTLASRLGPLERENRELKTRAEELAEKDQQWAQKERRRVVRDDLRAGAETMKVLSSAVPDVLDIGERLFERTEDGKTVTRDGVGVTPGLEPQAWLTEVQQAKPHWWPASVGGGATGSRSGGGVGKNPFSDEHWDMREQASILRENPDRAEQLAKMAGTEIGKRPAPRK